MKDQKKIFMAIMALSTFILSYILITPIVANIHNTFSNYSLNKIQFIVTLIPLASIFSMLFCDFLVQKISMKDVSIIGLFCIFIAGLISFFIKPNIIVLYLSSVILGLGVGFITVISSTLISYYFKGKEKMKAMGYQSIFVSLGATFFSYFSGVLANINWRFSYGCFFTTIIVLIIIILFLPDKKLKEKNENKKFKMNKRVYLLGFISILFFIGINVFSSSISVLVGDMGYNSYTSGVVTSIYTIIGIIAGLFLNNIVGIMKEHTLTFTSFMAFIGFTILGFSYNIFLINIGSMLIGYAFATRSPAGITFSSNMVNKNRSALAIAILNISSQFGSFISPFIINILTDSLKGSIHMMFIITSVFMLFVTIIHFFFNPIQKDDLF